MKIKGYAVVVVWVCMSAVWSCSKPARQLPSNKVQSEDAAVTMTLVNMRLAEEADRQCTEYVKQSGLPFVLEDCSCWLLLSKRTENDLLQLGEKVSFVVTVSLLDSTLIDNSEVVLEIGKNDNLPCFDYLLQLLHEGEEATAVVPYYLAYGKDGNGKAPALANCLITFENIKTLNE